MAEDTVLGRLKELSAITDRALERSRKRESPNYPEIETIAFVSGYLKGIIHTITETDIKLK